MNKKVAYDNIGKIYNLVYIDTVQKVPFVIKILKKYKKKNILEIGSGTGLFTIPLKKKGFLIEGLDNSKAIIKASKEKDPSLKIYYQDMISFSLKKKYDAILLLSSTLVLLKNHKQIKKCLQLCNKYLQNNGLLLLELPNHPVEIKKYQNTQEIFCNKEKSSIVVTQRTKTSNLWREYWHIFNFHKNIPSHNLVFCDELLYSQTILQKDLNDIGFNILECYGDLYGNSFNKKKSLRYVLICKKNYIS